MKAVRLTVVTACVVVAAGVFVWWSYRSHPCKKLEDRLCAFSPGSCNHIKTAFKYGKPTPEACRKGNVGMDGIVGVDMSMQATMVRMMFSELFGMKKLDATIHDSMLLMNDIALDLKRHRSPDANIKKFVALGPTACGTVLTRLRDGKDSEEMVAILWDLLLRLRGKDLGDEPGPWQDWCSGVLRANVEQK